MLQRYSVCLRIHSWFMKYCHPKLASAGVIAAFPVVTLVGANTIFSTPACVSLDEPELVDNVLTFLSGYDTLEYSWVKATTVSMRLRILFVTLQSTNKLSGTVAGERQLHYLRSQSTSYLFYFLSFFLNPRYPWSSHPFHDSLTPRASSRSHHPHRIHFFRQAVNPALPSKPWFESIRGTMFGLGNSRHDAGGRAVEVVSFLSQREGKAMVHPHDRKYVR